LPAQGTVYLSGVLSTVGALARNRVAAVDPTTAAVTPWNPNSNGTVRTLAVDAANVYIGGTFTGMSGVPSGNLAAVTTDASAPPPRRGPRRRAPPLAGGIAGPPYGVPLAASGGASPYCYRLSAGALPAGITLDPASGLVAGTPAAPGVAVFSVTATDIRGCTG